MKAIHALLLFLLISLAGCASAEAVRVTSDSSGTITYATNRTVMGSQGMNVGLSSNQRVMWHAEAHCTGDGCRPETVELVFHNDSSTDLNLDYRSIRIEFDGLHQMWTDLIPQDNIFYTVPRGEFVRVLFPADLFAYLAAAQDVQISFGMSGGSVFVVSHDRREPFRALAHAASLEVEE